MNDAVCTKEVGRPTRKIDVFARVTACDSDDGPGWLLLNTYQGSVITAEKALRQELALSKDDPWLLEGGLVFYDGDLLVGILRIGDRGPEMLDLERGF